MQINRTINGQMKPAKTELPAQENTESSAQETAEPSAPFQDSFEPGFWSAGLSVAGSTAAMVGAFTDSPALMIGGAVATLAGSGLTAMRVQNNGGEMDQAAWVTTAAVGGLAGAALITQLPQAAPAGPNGPLPQFLREIGVKALPM